jgi:hypothetical protein
MEIVWQVTDDNSTVIDVGRDIGGRVPKRNIGYGRG